MSKEKVVSEQPVVEVPKEIATEEAPGVSESDKKRMEIEAIVIKENETIPETVSDETPQEETVAKPEVKAEPKADVETKPEDTVDRIKKSVQKRIDKEVAKRKTLEEELEELRLENAALKSKKAETVVSKDDKPTIEQCEAYIIKMRQEGNVQEEIAAMRYLVQLEKEAAIESVKKEQEKQTQAVVKQQTDWANLVTDYLVYDEKGAVDNTHELSLSNQKGLLYTTAMSLYQDKELNKQFYNDPDKIQGFRRAVADAYREIHQQGLFKPKTREEVIPVPKNKTQVLAEPSSDAVEETTPSVSSNLSDADKVRLEIKRRKEFSNKRAAFLI